MEGSEKRKIGTEEAGRFDQRNTMFDPIYLWMDKAFGYRKRVGMERVWKQCHTLLTRAGHCPNENLERII